MDDASNNNKNAEEFAIGCFLSIKTTFGDEFQGQVVAFDRPSNFLALRTVPQEESSKVGGGGRKNIRFLKANYIKDLAFLGQGDDPVDLTECCLDLSTLQAREELALRQAEAEAERIGVGVTAEAQNIFDALSKTLPVHRDKTVIVVMNEVHVNSSYVPESVSGGTPAANERVKKVLELERSRLHARGGQ